MIWPLIIMKLITLQDAYTAETHIETRVAPAIGVKAVHIAMPALGTCNIQYMT